MAYISRSGWDEHYTPKSAVQPSRLQPLPKSSSLIALEAFGRHGQSEESSEPRVSQGRVYR